MFRLPSMIAAVGCVPTYRPRALLGVFVLGFILSSEKPL